jgi:hypothetical protein
MIRNFILPTSRDFFFRNFMVFLRIFNLNRYGFFSGNFDLLFYINNIECILREKSNGYELRVATQNFYYMFMMSKRKNRSQWIENKKLAQRLSISCAENKNKFTLDTYIDHIYKFSPSVISVLNKDSSSLSNTTKYVNF